MIFSDFLPSNIVKLENVSLSLSYSRPFLSYSSIAATVVNNFVISTEHFKFIPTPSLDFQVSLNLDEAAPLMTHL